MIQHDHCIELFGPHASCWGADTLLVWLHTLADSAVALSYFAIPAALFYLARKYRVKRLSNIFIIYGLFILLCGLTHVFDVLTVWYANYWVYLADGAVRAATGAVSIVAAVVTVRCTPFALSAFARLAAMERPARERREQLQSGPRYGTVEDRQWALTLAQLEDLSRQARATLMQEEA